MAEKQSQQQLQVGAGEAELKGRFASAVQIQAMSDHFVLDFYMLAPPAGQLVSRVVLTPQHVKGLIGIMKEQLDKYEATFGNVQAQTPSEKAPFGFKTT